MTTDESSESFSRRFARSFASVAAAAVILAILAGTATVMISSAPFWQWALASAPDDGVLPEPEFDEVHQAY